MVPSFQSQTYNRPAWTAIPSMVDVLSPIVARSESPTDGTGGAGGFGSAQPAA